MENDTSQALRMFLAMDRMRRAWSEVTPCEGVSKSQFATLLVILYGGRPPHGAGLLSASLPPPEQSAGVSLSEVAAVMGQTVPALSQRVSRMEALGYVERLPHPTDRRASLLRVTGEGRALLEQARRNIARRMEGILARMGEDSMDRLLALLEQLADVMEQSNAGGGAAREGEDSPCGN